MGIRLRSRWPLIFIIVLSLLAASYYFYLRSEDLATFILVYGILGTALIPFLTLYIIRKKVYRYRFGSAQGWLQSHLYIGVICFALIHMHSGFTLKGTFSISLFVLFLLVIISGVVGSLIYIIIPLSLSKYGRDVKSEDEIIHDIENYLKEANDLVPNTSETCKEFYRKEIRPFFLSKRTKWKYLFMEEKELLDKRRDLIERCKNMVPNQDVHELDILGSILIEKEKLFFMLVKLRLQKIWLSFHLPLTSALFVAIIIHILSMIYY